MSEDINGSALQYNLLDERYRFVTNLYEGILNRRGDPAGIDANVRSLGEEPTFQKGEALLSAFLESPERKAKFKPPHFVVSATMVSVGSHCLTSTLLKRIGVKRWSGPFDWIFSNISMVAHCIENNFEIFLDPKFHVKVSDDKKIAENPQSCEHLFYKENFGINNIFNHHDLTDIRVRQYYERCVDRFMKALQSEDRVVLVGICSTVSEAEFDKLNCVLADYKNVRPVIVRTSASDPRFFGYREMLTSRSGSFWEAHLLGNMGPTEFTNIADELLMLSVLASSV